MLSTVKLSVVQVQKEGSSTRRKAAAESTTLTPKAALGTARCEPRLKPGQEMTYRQESELRGGKQFKRNAVLGAVREGDRDKLATSDKGGLLIGN